MIGFLAVATGVLMGRMYEEGRRDTGPYARNNQTPSDPISPDTYIRCRRELDKMKKNEAVTHECYWILHPPVPPLG